MSMLKLALEQRDAKQAELDALLKVAEDEKRTALTAEEDTQYAELRGELVKLDERIAELAEDEKRSQAAAEARKLSGTTVAVGDGVKSEPNPVYRADRPEVSFFRDLAAVKYSGIAPDGIPSFDEARARLAASQERRTTDTVGTSGHGSDLAPPLYLTQDFVTLARPGRVTANLVNSQPLPSGHSSINLPRVTSGTDADVQQTEATSVTDVQLGTDSISSGITTVAGKQTVSLQLLQQSGVAFDRVVLQDLAKAYAVRLNKQVLYGTNANGQLRGISHTSVATAVSFSTASPAVASTTAANSLYGVIAKAGAAVQAAVFEPADALIMHPRRWAWVLGSVDAQSRPLVVPAGPALNQAGTDAGLTAQGFAGTFGQYPVYLDPTIATNLGASTNADEIYLVKRDELWLYESPVMPASFDATLADQLVVLYRVHGYAAFLPHRRAGVVQQIGGTGLVAP